MNLEIKNLILFFLYSIRDGKNIIPGISST